MIHRHVPYIRAGFRVDVQHNGSLSGQVCLRRTQNRGLAEPARAREEQSHAVAEHSLDMGDLILAANDVVETEVDTIAEWTAVDFHSDAFWIDFYLGAWAFTCLYPRTLHQDRLCLISAAIFTK